jgi:hypothetical protein
MPTAHKRAADPEPPRSAAPSPSPSPAGAICCPRTEADRGEGDGPPGIAQEGGKTTGLPSWALPRKGKPSLPAT